MPIKVHFWLGNIAIFIAALAGLYGLMDLDLAAPRWNILRQGMFAKLDVGTLRLGLQFALVIGVPLLVRFLILAVVPARCPICGNRAYREGGDRVVYACRSCGNKADTGITETYGGDD